MSVITEIRLKCDECGAVSPVTHHSDISEHGTPQARALVLPRGWQEVQQREAAQMFTPYDLIIRDRGTDTLMPAPTLAVGIKLSHFCCEAHHAAWLEKQGAEL